jgi:tetratricopeptide (TPR) repeat protein
MNQNIFLQWKKEFDADNLFKAIKILEGENKNSPSDLQCLYHLGFTWRFIGDFEKAEKYYIEALQIDADNNSVNLGLGIVYQMKGNFDNAIKYLEKATESSQFNVNAFNSLGLTYKKKGYLDKAIETYLQGIKRLFSEIYIDLSKQQVIKNIPHKDVVVNKWVKFSIEAMIKGAANDDIEILGWPTSEQVLEFYKEVKDDSCWKDWVEVEKKRLVIPQYLEAIREKLSSNLMYSILTNNLGSVFVEKNNKENANKWFQESIAFILFGVNYPNPEIGLQELEK